MTAPRADDFSSPLDFHVSRCVPPVRASAAPAASAGRWIVSVSDETPGGAVDFDLASHLVRAVVAGLRNHPDGGAAVGAAVVETTCVNDDRMRAENRRLLGHDWTTDVVTVPLGGDGSGFAPLEGCLLLNPAEAARRAPEHPWPPHDLSPATRELMLYAAHGTLHLCGLDDATDEQRTEMRRAEAAALAACGVAVPAGHAG